MNSVCRLCSAIAAGLDRAWVPIGWALFVVWFLGPHFASPAIGRILFLTAGLGVLGWWLIDAVDQDVAWWPEWTPKSRVGR